MTQREFEKRIKKENLKMKDYALIVGRLLEEINIMGIYNDNGVWKIYETGERDSTPYICEEFTDEYEAYDWLYERIKRQIKVENL